jgi:hypothetical protein
MRCLTEPGSSGLTWWTADALSKITGTRRLLGRRFARWAKPFLPGWSEV